MAYMTSGRLVPNFSLAEMTNKLADEKIKLVLTPEVVEHAQMMQELRDWYGASMEVSSWYRTKAFNKACGGASNSAHLDGRATDIKGIPEDLYHDFIVAWQTICASHREIGGCELYSWGIHFDSHSDKFGCEVFRIKDNR